MPNNINGIRIVKSGHKSAPLNLSNARRKTYAELQNMTAEQKKGVIICSDYPTEPVSGANVEYSSGVSVNDAINGKMPLPNYTNIIATLTTAGGSYTCLQDGWLIGSMTGASNGWASIREASQSSYLLAIDTTPGTGGTGVCIPFKKGNAIQLGAQGTYNLAFIGV